MLNKIKIIIGIVAIMVTSYLVWVGLPPHFFDIFGFVIFIFLFGLGLSRLRFMNNMYQLLLHNLYIFILSLFHQHIGVKNSIKFMSLISTIFIFILFCNFIGLFPYGFAITSHMLVTFGLSVSIFVGIVIFSF